jgi:hypothetical protein
MINETRHTVTLAMSWLQQHGKKVKNILLTDTGFAVGVFFQLPDSTVV